MLRAPGTPTGSWLGYSRRSSAKAVLEEETLKMFNTRCMLELYRAVKPAAPHALSVFVGWLVRFLFLFFVYYY